MNLKTFDLNLLRVLERMLVHRNTTRVAEVVGITQPAVSAALNRLRQSLSDPLFVREGNAMVPTAFALSLEEPVRMALSSLEYALSGGTAFDPATCERSFCIAGSDFFNEMLMPKLAERIMRVAPNVKLKLLSGDILNFNEILSTGRSDMFLTIPLPQPDWVDKALAFESSFIVAARKDHPSIKEIGLGWGEVMPLDLFCSNPHAIFSVEEGYFRFEDSVLEDLNRTRPISISVPSFYGVGRVVAQTDLFGVLPTRFALAIANRLGLQIYRLPFDMPLIRIYLYWHKRETAHRENAWLRAMVLDLLAPLDEISHPVEDKDFSSVLDEKIHSSEL